MKTSAYLLACLTLAAAPLHAQPAPARPAIITLPEVRVTAPAMALEPLQEEALVGENQQPAWTMARRFPTTRVYVQREPWEMGFEQWWRGRFYRDGKIKQRYQTEVEIGLPHRMQFDLYENIVSDKLHRTYHENVAVELRYALAEWGKIPLNPALYGEYKFANKKYGPDVYEFKLLLGEQFAPRWHWGFNAIYEQEVGQNRATEMAWSQGISYTVIDQKLSLGVEMKFEHETERGTRSQPEIRFNVGPSFQWHLTPRLHLDALPLIGVTKDAPRVESFIILSFDLGKLGSGNQGRAPTSLRGN